MILTKSEPFTPEEIKQLKEQFRSNSMTNAQMLAGSLSNDLFRVAALTQRGSTKAALRFLKEAQRWAGPLAKENVAGYIIEIAEDISSQSEGEISLKDAEQHLMYGVLLQNYALQIGEAK